MSKIKTVVDKSYNVLKIIAGMLLVLMLAITFTQVIMRKVFSNAFTWAEEVTLAMLIWFAYISISLVVKDDGHMSIEFLYNRFNKNGRIILDTIKHILMIGFSYLMIVYGGQMANNALGKNLPASQLSRSLLYIPLVLSGVLIIIFSITHLINLFIKPDGEGGMKQ